MRSHAGRGREDVPDAADEGINIKVITTSEIKISVLIDRKYMELAVQALHDAFELDKAGLNAARGLRPWVGHTAKGATPGPAPGYPCAIEGRRPTGAMVQTDSRKPQAAAPLAAVMAEDGRGAGAARPITQLIADSMGTEVCSIYLFRDEDTLELCATEGLNPRPCTTRMRLGEGLVGRVARGQVINTANAPGRARVPLHARDRRGGVFLVLPRRADPAAGRDGWACWWCSPRTRANIPRTRSTRSKSWPWCWPR
jgi:hypothetical protein